jgi:mRNA interferase MazF
MATLPVMKDYTMTIRAGDFWIADIVFTDRSASKKRPVLILWLDGEDAIVAVVTSSSPRTVTDILLQDWRDSGLRVASTVRLSRLDSLERSLFLSRIGRISEADAAKVQEIWSTHIKPDF